jgi:hypothetical protein
LTTPQVLDQLSVVHPVVGRQRGGHSRKGDGHDQPRYDQRHNQQAHRGTLLTPGDAKCLRKRHAIGRKEHNARNPDGGDENPGHWRGHAEQGTPARNDGEAREADSGDQPHRVSAF